jgi:ERCC4-type nuclease
MTINKLAESQRKSKIINLSDFVLIIDSQEKENRHIIDFLNLNAIQYTVRHLNFGDYSFIYQGQSFQSLIAVERKNSLEELSGNLFKWRERFEREHERAKSAYRFYWLIEHGSITDIYTAAYEERVNKHGELVKANENAFIGKVLSMQSKYNLQIDFVSKELIGRHIMNIFFYYLRNVLKGVDCSGQNVNV